jgi:hypothetical protein
LVAKLPSTIRVAIFLFGGDAREAGDPPRGYRFGEIGCQTDLSLLLVDRPEGLSGHSSAFQGRFTRRFVECIQHFLSVAKLGYSARCSNGAYANGGDIPWPKNVIPWNGQIAPTSFLQRLVGKWAGDDTDGSYWIFQTVDVVGSQVTMLVGFSPSPLTLGTNAWTPGATVKELIFSVDEPQKSLDWQSPVNGYRYVLRASERGSLLVDVHPPDNRNVWRAEFPRMGD